MGKNRAKYGGKNKLQSQYRPSSKGKKSRFPNGVRLLIAFAFLTVVAIAFFVVISSPPASSTGLSSTQGYPQYVSPAWVSSPAISSGGAKVSVPASFVNATKLAFVDLKLTENIATLEYQGRTIPLSYYKGGDYLPLVLISAPSGNIITGIRVCEPCGSFSFHIVQGKNLKCDVCGAEWDVETFAGISGGCLSYPPPKLTATVTGDNVEIDLSYLGTTVTA